MKVLFVARNIPVPGIEENDIILVVARRLIARGIRIEIVFPAEWLPVPRFVLGSRAKALASLPDRFEVQGIPVTVWRYLRFPGKRLSYVLAGLRLGGGHWSLHPDLVHAHYVLPDGEIARRIAERLQRPYVVTARKGDWNKLGDLPPRSPLRRFALRVLRCAAAALSPARIVADRFTRWGIDVKVLPHGVEAMHAGVGLEPCSGTLVISVAAKLDPGKQVDWVVLAVAALERSRPIELRIMGSGSGERSLRSLALRLGVKARFFGQVPREVVLENLRESHIFALPSISETFGLAYIEASVAGCAVIATRGTGVDGLFVDRSEMLFQNGRYEDFEACLKELVEDEAARISLARRGRERVMNDYLLDSVVDKYVHVYESVLAGHANRAATERLAV